MASKEGWLRYGQATLAWAHFQRVDNSRVRVMALTGAASYIDRVMIRGEAIDLWKQMLQDGWHQATKEELKAEGMTGRCLQYMIYD